MFIPWWIIIIIIIFILIILSTNSSVAGSISDKVDELETRIDDLEEKTEGKYYSSNRFDDLD